MVLVFIRDMAQKGIEKLYIATDCLIFTEKAFVGNSLDFLLLLV
jgi:hypothetical protein